jgi:hypothetical protein
MFWISDPGHEWLVVPLAEVERVGYAPSEYSFISECGTLAYLEGDCDAAGFLYKAGLLGQSITSTEVAEFKRPRRRFSGAGFAIIEEAM